MADPPLVPLPITPSAVAALGAEVRGPVLRPGQDGYDRDRTVFNLLRTPEPELLVGAVAPADVQAAVRFAVAHDRPVAVIGGGHGGLLPDPDAILVTTRRMRTVTVDPLQRTARIEAGALFSDVLAALAPHGMAALNGSSAAVGAVGFTLNGGMSPFLGRSYGWASQRVRSVDLVTADGELRTVTADGDPELFRAVRGTRGNFGVATAVEVELFPISTLYGGRVTFAGERAAEVLAAWREWTATVPDEMSSSYAVLRAPGTPAVVTVRIAYLGWTADGERMVRPLRALRPELGDSVAEMRYADSPAIHADPTGPMPVRETAVELAGLTAETAAEFVRAFGPGSDSPLAVAELRLLGGALARPAEVPDAVVNRRGAYQVTLIAAAPPRRLAAVTEFQRAAEERLAPWATGTATPAYLTTADAADPERVRAAYDPETWAWLRGLKARWDPANTFRVNSNIPPAE